MIIRFQNNSCFVERINNCSVIRQLTVPTNKINPKAFPKFVATNFLRSQRHIFYTKDFNAHHPSVLFIIIFKDLWKILIFLWAFYVDSLNFECELKASIFVFFYFFLNKQIHKISHMIKINCIVCIIVYLYNNLCSVTIISIRYLF